MLAFFFAAAYSFLFDDIRRPQLLQAPHPQSENGFRAQEHCLISSDGFGGPILVRLVSFFLDLRIEKVSGESSLM